MGNADKAIKWTTALMLLLAFSLALGMAATAQAAEHILVFLSDVQVQANGDLLVTEHIKVRSELDQIKRGLLRDFPTTYKAPDGTRVEIGFEVLGVRRDGKDESYEQERLANGVRIRIGSPDVWLTQGLHDYEIRYRTTRQIGFFKDFDELYWNVTGNGWTFPIDHAIARIRLPQNADISRTSVYTGPQGARGKEARVAEKGPGYIVFETTAPLDVTEGLTVAAGWQKGVVIPPSQTQILLYRLRDNIATAVAALGFLLLTAYYVIARLATRRRGRGAIVPLYEPPEGMSAPAVRYLVRKGIDKQTFVVGILELIALRAMRIDQPGGTPKFHLLEPTAHGRRGLERDNMLGLILHKLFRTNKSFTRSAGNGTRFSDAVNAVESSLRTQYDPMIHLNRKVATRGLWLWILLMALCVAITWWQDGGAAQMTLMSVPFLIPPLLGMSVMYGAWRERSASLGTMVMLTLFCGPFLIASLALLASDFPQAPLRVITIALPLLLFPVAIRAYQFVKGYNDDGYRVMDQINGFKQYLTLAEAPRLQALATTEEKLQLYERYLPYAVALGVGKNWAAAFAGLTATVAGIAAVQAMHGYYGGHDIFDRDPTGGVRSLGSEVSPGYASSASSSSGSPGSSGSWSGSSDSSSSGSSDGGSSGDGGGGGGGSGW